jgi:hypothetical protein
MITFAIKRMIIAHGFYMNAAFLFSHLKATNRSHL